MRSCYSFSVFVVPPPTLNVLKRVPLSSLGTLPRLRPPLQIKMAGVRLKRKFHGKIREFEQPTNRSIANIPQGVLLNFVVLSCYFFLQLVVTIWREKTFARLTQVQSKNTSSSSTEHKSQAFKTDDPEDYGPAKCATKMEVIIVKRTRSGCLVKLPRDTLTERKTVNFTWGKVLGDGIVCMM